MKGIIFNILEAAIERKFDADTWDDILDRAGLDGSYTSLGNYGDDEFLAIVNQLPEATGRDLAARLRWIGIQSMPSLVEVFPQAFDQTTLAAFLPTLNHMIHPEVRKLYPGAHPPDFEIQDNSDGVITLRYHSERKLCWLAEGFVLGVSEQLNEPVTISQPVCMHNGDDHCELDIVPV